MEEERLFLDPALSIGKLAEHTGVPARELSTALNQHFEKNFYTFVNEYRVEEVKEKLRDPDFQHLTILSIALDAGFNSKATFNRILRALHGNFSPKLPGMLNRAPSRAQYLLAGIETSYYSY